MKATQPFLLDLSLRGWVEGVTHLDRESQPLCHYFGGIPYALPPLGPYRFQKPRPLPPCYRYGTRAAPGQFTGGTGYCPQPTPDDRCEEELWNEDCLQTNVWLPVGEPPEGGWPVLFWIHGGFLQFGSPAGDDLRAMLSDTACKCIVVEPAYRLNVFGFLASPELLDAPTCDFDTNVGFWDQRLALEWAWQNVSYFGGNAANITIGGYSAGSHSTFRQLAFDLGLPDEKSIVKRAMMLSNGPGLQPKSLEDAQTQFNELLETLKIPLDLSPMTKLAKLRTLDAKALIKATMAMKYHQFRGVTDGSFIRRGLFNELDVGVFAERMKRRGVKLIMGECRDEHFIYGIWRTPQNDRDSLLRRLEADYSSAACEALMHYYFPNGQLPAKYSSWQDAFGYVYADIQIHHLERGMVSSLVRHGAGHLVHRYRMEWRASCCDNHWPREWGVTHGTDMMIWFWGSGDRLSKRDKLIAGRAFHNLFARYVKGEEIQAEWGTKEDPMTIRTLKSDGRIEVEADKWLDEGLRVWEVLKKVGATGWSRTAKL